MPPVDPLELALHLDRVRRENAPARRDMVAREFGGPAAGWLTARPDVDGGEFASWSMNRILWLDARKPLVQADLDAAIAAAREIGGSARRMFIWAAPWAVDAGFEAILTSAGAAPIPHVQYLALVAPALASQPERPSTLSVRIIDRNEADSVLGSMRGWYSDDGITRAINIVHAGGSESHVAFDHSGPAPKAVALSLLSVDRAPIVPGGQVWAHLSSTGTDPEFRSRGAQTALILYRVARAAALGATVCTCETNTAIATSLNNLRRCGFTEAIAWRVFRWEDG